MALRWLLRQTVMIVLFARELSEAARELAKRDMLSAGDVDCPPFCGLSDVDDDGGAGLDHLRCCGGVDAGRAREDAHCSGVRRALDDGR
jgi:hypothetical protein